MTCFCRYIYAKKIDFDDLNEAEAIFYLARKYEILDLEYACLRYIRDGLSVETVCLAYEIARLFGDKELEDVCFDIIRNKTGQVLLSKGFLECDASTVAAIMEHKVLSVNSEFELFYAIEKWYAHNKYPESIKKAVEHIQFLRMSHQDFVKGPMVSDLLSNEEKLKIVSCITMKGTNNNEIYDMPPFYTDATDRITFDRSDENIFKMLNDIRNNPNPPFFTCQHYTEASINHIIIKCSTYHDRRAAMLGALQHRELYESFQNPLYTIIDNIMFKNGLDIEGRKILCDYIRHHKIDLTYLLKLAKEDIDFILRLEGLLRPVRP